MMSKYFVLSFVVFLSTQLSYSQTSSIIPNTYGEYEIIGEQIVIIENSGTNYISFFTIRTPFDKTGWSLDKNVTLDDFLQSFLYLNPIDYNWDDKSSPLYNYFTFSKGSYGVIIRGFFELGVSVKNNETLFIDEGVFKYKNEDGVKELSGNYGFSYEKFGFQQFTYAWILPQNWEFVSYKTESPGRWSLHNNTLIFIGKNINNLVFDIEYRRKKSEILQQIKQDWVQSHNDEVEIQEIDNGLQMIFSEKIFFSTGDTSLNAYGNRILDQVANLMKKNPKFKLQIHGHTDNIKVKKSNKKISNNWELSVFRSLSILNYLTQEKGIPGERFEVHGYGEYRPIASNETPEGRAKNRRIELFLMNNQ